MAAIWDSTRAPGASVAHGARAEWQSGSAQPEGVGAAAAPRGPSLLALCLLPHPLL